MFYKVSFCVFASVLAIVQWFCFHSALEKVRDSKSRYEIDLDFYANTISNSVFQYMQDVFPKSTEENPVASLDPKIAFVDNLSTWQDYRGRPFCLLDGVRYCNGDYSPYGLVTLIKDGRVYCRQSDQITIIRARPSPTARAVGGVGPEDAPL